MPKLAIDSKFPLDAFNELSTAGSVSGITDSQAQRTAKSAARKRLTDHLLTHVRHIATKYIVPGGSIE